MLRISWVSLNRYTRRANDGSITPALLLRGPDLGFPVAAGEARGPGYCAYRPIVVTKIGASWARGSVDRGH
jgi:hypothetical protein